MSTSIGRAARLTGVAMGLAIMAGAGSAAAQNHPFPTSGKYAHGFIPSTATVAKVQSSYDSWKTNQLKTDCGGSYYRVDNSTGDASTYSEGQGYGMVLTAYMGDRAAFDGLWAFAKKNYDSANMMGWHVTCSGATTSDGGAGSATDGDTDIGFGLLVAAAQWGGTYLADAMTYLTALKAADFTTCMPSGRVMATRGNWQGMGTCSISSQGSNTSYWMPAYYRVFAAVTGDAFWTKAADDAITLYGLAMNQTTGIIINEVDQNGMPVPGDTYDYNSCRIPYRAALDYLWNGTAGAAAMTTKLTNWANGVGVQNLVDGYKADGTPVGTNKGINAFVGGFTVGAMTDSQSIVDNFSTFFTSISDTNGTYYGSSLRTLYLITLSGNQWNPVDMGIGTGSSSGGSSGSSSGSTGSSSGSTGSSSGGTSASSSGATSSSGGDGGPNGDASKGGSGGGCGCTTLPSRTNVASLALLGGALGLVARRRRRRA